MAGLMGPPPVKMKTLHPRQVWTLLLFKLNREPKAELCFYSTSMTSDVPSGVDGPTYYRLLESMPVMLWTADAGGIWHHVNEAWTRYTGVLGPTRGFGFEEALHPEDLSRVLAVWQAAVRARTPYEIEYRLRHVEGGYRWFLIRGVPVVDAEGVQIAWVGTCTDIEAQKRAEQDSLAAREAAVRALGLAMEARDHATQGHTDRVTALALRLGRALRLDAATLAALRLGAYLHDVGKLAIPDAVLLKPGRLNEAEWALMRAHVTDGARFAAGLGFLSPDTLAVVEQHHERWDGSGYPDGRSGTKIHPLARLFSVVDVYDALISERPYKAAWTPEAAGDELRRESGRQFDPAMVEAFLAELSTHAADPVPTP